MSYQRSGEQNAVPTVEFLVERGWGQKAEALQRELQTRLAAGDDFREAFGWMLLRHAKPLERVGWCADGERGRDFTINPGMAEIWRAAGLHVREVFA